MLNAWMLCSTWLPFIARIWSALDWANCFETWRIVQSTWNASTSYSLPRASDVMRIKFDCYATSNHTEFTYLNTFCRAKQSRSASESRVNWQSLKLLSSRHSQNLRSFRVLFRPENFCAFTCCYGRKNRDGRQFIFNSYISRHVVYKY